MLRPLEQTRAWAIMCFGVARALEFIGAAAQRAIMFSLPA